jgi:hypothetical protein
LAHSSMLAASHLGRSGSLANSSSRSTHAPRRRPSHAMSACCPLQDWAVHPVHSALCRCHPNDTIPDGRTAPQDQSRCVAQHVPLGLPFAAADSRLLWPACEVCLHKQLRSCRVCIRNCPDWCMLATCNSDRV